MSLNYKLSPLSIVSFHNSNHLLTLSYHCYTQEVAGHLKQVAHGSLQERVVHLALATIALIPLVNVVTYLLLRKITPIGSRDFQVLQDWANRSQDPSQKQIRNRAVESVITYVFNKTFELNLSFLQLGELPPLNLLLRVKKMHLCSNLFTEVEALSELKELQFLDLRNNPNLQIPAPLEISLKTRLKEHFLFRDPCPSFTPANLQKLNNWSEEKTGLIDIRKRVVTCILQFLQQNLPTLDFRNLGIPSLKQDFPYSLWKDHYLPPFLDEILPENTVILFYKEEKRKDPSQS